MPIEDGLIDDGLIGERSSALQRHTRVALEGLEPRSTS
jgi:hypothetical protein